MSEVMIVTLMADIDVAADLRTHANFITDVTAAVTVAAATPPYRMFTEMSSADRRMALMFTITPEAAVILQLRLLDIARFYSAPLVWQEVSAYTVLTGAPQPA